MHAVCTFLAALLPLTTAAAPLHEQPGYVRAEFIYETAPFPECHASTLVETPAGLVAAWFGGTTEKNRDVGIWSARHREGKWTAPVEVANGNQPDGSRLPCWNPVLFRAQEGTLLLFYKVGPDPSTWWGLLRTSKDDGASWSEARRLPEGILGPIKNKPVQLADGAILCPTSTETPDPDDKWRVHFEITRDLGATWRKTAPAGYEGAEFDAIQPSILFHGGARLQALGRTRAKKVFEVWSEDSGATWGKMRLLAVPNPNAGTDALTLADGRHLLVYNPTERGRSPLAVALSKDGRAWQPAPLILEDEPGKEFSYPACIQTRDGLVHVTYTWKRTRVRHVVLDPAKFDAGSR